jgi:predicted Zn-dependent protease
MDLAYKANEATKKGDHQAAIKYYKALIKAVPDRSVSYTRLCESYEAAGDWKSAVETCATALTRDGVTVNEYAHYFTVALAKKGALSGQEVDVLSNVLDHLRGDPAGRQVVDDLTCQLGVRLEDVKRLEQCTTALAAKAPADPRTISYQWALALKRGNFDEAADLIERARATDMKPEGIDNMVRGTEAILATRRRRFYAWGFGALAIALGLGAATVFFVSRRRRTFGSAAT